MSSSASACLLIALALALTAALWAVANLRFKERRNRAILRSVFPEYVTRYLTEGVEVPPRKFGCIAVYFCDVVGFTDLASSLPPIKIVALLDRLYDVFDGLVVKHGLFKVETIGDAYMVCSALSGDRSTVDNAAQMSAYALEAASAAQQVLIDQDNSSLGQVQIRSGFHCGPVIGGVVGRSTPRFCLFGDTVNVAARMEQNSAPGQITVSDEVARVLQSQGEDKLFNLISRGHICVKGKGLMQLWWLVPGGVLTPTAMGAESSNSGSGSPQVWRRSSSLSCQSPFTWRSGWDTPQRGRNEAVKRVGFLTP